MNSLDINPRIILSITRAKLDDFGLILSYSAPDLARITQLSLNDVSILQTSVAEKIIKQPSITALQIFQGRCPDCYKHSYLSLGCKILDGYLGGGVLTRGITEIVGESSSGKTQLCMQLSLIAQLPPEHGGLGTGTIYICTEDVFPNKRLVQMTQLLKDKVHNQVENFTDKIFIEHAAEMDDLWHCVKRKVPILLSQSRVGLVIIDSVAALFRCEFGLGDTIKRAKQLSSFAAYLHRLSNKYSVPVVCVNQVSGLVNRKQNTGEASSRNRQNIPALGMAWSNLLTCRLMLQRTTKYINIQQRNSSGNQINSIEANVRSIEILLAPHLPNSVSYYYIDHEGVKGLQT